MYCGEKFLSIKTNSSVQKMRNLFQGVDLPCAAFVGSDIDVSGLTDDFIFRRIDSSQSPVVGLADIDIDALSK
jgi:hypothetical protein